MTKPDWVGPPKQSVGDVVHTLVKAGSSVATAGVGGDLFGFLIQSPFQKRTAEWMERVEMRLTHLAARDRDIIDRLPTDEVFISVFMSATQAAIRTHQLEKLQLLASAVEHSAVGTDVSADLQILFVRFVDELTPTHFALLGVLADHSEAVAAIDTYAALRLFFLSHAMAVPTVEEFKLFCNDLGARVLVRFSDAMEDFEGIAERELLATEASGRGIKVLVTDLGRALLRFVKDESARSAI